MPQDKKDLRIGCSGYYYSSWKGSFYPPKTAGKDMLKYYSSAFNTVELNSPFYHIPKLTSLQTQFENTPEDFKFSVKVNKTITHLNRLKDCKDLIKDFITLIQKGLGSKVACFLFQFPPSFIYTKTNLELILSEIPSGPENVLEFRHSSWWNEEVRIALQEKSITFCNVDFPKLPTEIRNESDVFYLRLHGTPNLFSSPYEDARLEYYAEQIPLKNRAYIYFNNTAGDNAWKNAQTLIKLEKNASAFLS